MNPFSSTIRLSPISASTFILIQDRNYNMDKPQKPKYKIITPQHIKTKFIMKAILSEKEQMMCGRFAYEDSLIACGYSDGSVRVYNINTQNKINQINTNCSEERMPVNCLRWRPLSSDLGSVSSVLLIANTDGHLCQYMAKTGKKLYEAQEKDNYIMALDYSRRGKTFATGGKDNIVRVYDQQTKKMMSQLKGVMWHSHGHSNRIFSVKFHPENENMVMSGGWDQNINIWDIRDRKVVSSICGPRIGGDAIDVQGDLLLTGSDRSSEQLQIWDLKTTKRIKEIKWDQQLEHTNSFIFCAQFCHNIKGGIMGVGGSQMKIFDMESSQCTCELRVDESESLYVCDTGHSSARYFVGGSTGSLYYLMSTKSYD